jgi:hypothetical protein
VRGAAARRSRPRREPRPPPWRPTPAQLHPAPPNSSPCPTPPPQLKVDIARRVFEAIGWPPAAVEWQCLSWAAMLEDLYAGGAEGDAAVAGMLVAARALERGVLFPWPTLQSSLGILVRSAAATRGGSFAFAEAFARQASSAKL